MIVSGGWLWLVVPASALPQQCNRCAVCHVLPFVWYTVSQHCQERKIRLSENFICCILNHTFHSCKVIHMPTLRPEQNDAAVDICITPHLLLADVGAGKTATALNAILRQHLLFGKQRVLVVGTKRICNLVWSEEISLWAPNLKYRSVAGLQPQQRKAILEDQSLDVVGINFDNLIWLANTYGASIAELFPLLVIDECSLLENPRSKTFKAFKPLLPAFQWRLPMTGTPRANHLYDLWGSVYLADLGKSLGEYREAFLQRWFFPVKRKVGIDWVPKAGAEEEIYAKARGVVHRMAFTQEKPIEINVLIPLNPEVKAINKLIDINVREDEDSVNIDNVTYASNGHRNFTKQLQLSSGHVYADDGSVIHLHTDKLEALQEIVKEAKGEPIMVVFQFDHERDAILEWFPQARLLDDDAVLAEWNQGKIEMLLVHPRSCGHGLNAQFSGSDLQVWFTPTPDAELYTQTVGRMNRPGSTKPLRVIRLIMQGTKDMASYLVVAARQRGEHATLEMFE